MFNTNSPVNSDSQPPLSAQMESLSLSHPKQASRLFPVQHLIFDILKIEIPLKLLRVSKTLYHQIIPTIFKTSLSPAGRNNGKITFNLGSRKLEALSHVKRLTFTDRATAEKFSKYMKLFANKVYNSSDSPMVFPSVTHVDLERDIVDVLFTTFDDITRPETIAMMMSIWTPMFLYALARHCQPTSISIGWPSEWSGDKDNDMWVEPGITFAGDPFFEKLVFFAHVKQIYINVSEFELLNIWLSFLEEDETTKIIINVLVAGDTKNWILLHEVMNHFEFLTIDRGDETRVKKNLEERLTYVLPDRKGLIEELEKQCEEGEYQEEMTKLDEMIVFRDNNLPEDEGEDEDEDEGYVNSIGTGL